MHNYNYSKNSVAVRNFKLQVDVQNDGYCERSELSSVFNGPDFRSLSI